MIELLTYIFLAIAAFVVFVILMRRGSFLRISEYIRETREELYKCTWPTWDELKGSTVVVVVACLLLGFFTIGIDFVVTIVVRHLV